jgi:hypothetical protein
MVDGSGFEVGDLRSRPVRGRETVAQLGSGLIGDVVYVISGKDSIKRARGKEENEPQMHTDGRDVHREWTRMDANTTKKTGMAGMGGCRRGWIFTTETQRAQRGSRRLTRMDANEARRGSLRSVLTCGLGGEALVEGSVRIVKAGNAVTRRCQVAGVEHGDYNRVVATEPLTTLPTAHESTPKVKWIDSTPVQE